jgi:putative NADPH-quinone reductase
MNVLAINSSPRSDAESYTAMLLQSLVEGMREEGAAVEVVALREKKIKYCTGCFSCWTKTPGICIHKDDMSRELFPKWLACDLVVYATPLYYHTINAMLAAFMERTLPAILPFFKQDANGKTYHPVRTRIPANVLLSVCGFPDVAEFDALREFQARTQHPEARTLAIICRAGASLLTSPFLAKRAKVILDATKEAGRELVRTSAVAPETLERIEQPLGSPALFDQMGNMFWQTCIDEKVTPKQFDDRKLMPRPRSIEDFLLMFTYAINARAAGDRPVFVQFKFSGAVPGECYFAVAGRRVNPCAGVCDAPTLVIETPFEVWMDILTRKADGAQMMMEGKYRVTGDLGLMLKLFSREKPAA